MAFSLEDFIIGLRQMGLSAAEIAREVLRVTRMSHETDDQDGEWSGGGEADYPDVYDGD